MVIGGHGGTTMIPLMRLASYNGIPVTKLLSNVKQKDIISSTMIGELRLQSSLGHLHGMHLARQFLIWLIAF